MSSCNTSCPTKVPFSETDGFEALKLIKEVACFTKEQGILNIFAALERINQSIKDHTDTVQQKGYASALIHFRIPGEAYVNGEVKSFQISRTPFNYKVVGIGASVVSFPASAGVYANDDILTVKVYDFTGNNQVGNNLTLSSVQLHDKHTDEGNPVGTNFANGHIYGAKISYANQDSGDFTAPDIDVYIHVEPVELVVEI